MEDLKVTTSRLLKELGVPVNLNGYEYLVEAIELVINDKAYIKAICKKLYPTIATQHGVTIGCVERSIRHAIKKSFERGNCDLINKIFGYTINPDTGFATNAEYIATLADYISMKEGCTK